MWHNSSCAALYVHPLHVQLSLRRGAPPFERERERAFNNEQIWFHRRERQHLKCLVAACAPLPRLEWSKEQIKFVHFLPVKVAVQTQSVPAGSPLLPFGCSLSLKALLLKRHTFVQMAPCWSTEWLTDASEQIQWCGDWACNWKIYLKGVEKSNSTEKCVSKDRPPNTHFLLRFSFHWSYDMKWSRRETRVCVVYLCVCRILSVAVPLDHH